MPEDAEALLLVSERYGGRRRCGEAWRASQSHGCGMGGSAAVRAASRGARGAAGAAGKPKRVNLLAKTHGARLGMQIWRLVKREEAGDRHQPRRLVIMGDQPWGRRSVR